MFSVWKWLDVAVSLWGSAEEAHRRSFPALLMSVFTGWCNNSPFLRISCELKDDLPLIKRFITSHVKPVSSLLGSHNTRVPLRSRAVTSSINQADREHLAEVLLWLRVWGYRLLLCCDSGLFALNVCVIHQECYDESACPSWSVLSISTGVWCPALTQNTLQTWHNTIFLSIVIIYGD